MKYVSPDQAKPVYSAEYDLIIQETDDTVCALRYKIRLTKLKTGRSRRYTLCTLPFNKGTKNAPIININPGGITLIIVVFTPFNNFSQYKLCS
jgi:hypothetical protein